MQKKVLLMPLAVAMLASCSTPKGPKERELAPAVINEGPGLVKVELVQEASTPQPRIALTFEQELERDLKIADKFYLDAQFQRAAAVLTARLESRPRSQFLSKNDLGLLTQAAKLELRSLIGAAFIKYLPQDIYRTQGERALFTNSNGREFVGWIIEDYKGASDKEEVEQLDIVRFDSLKARLPKSSFRFRRLKEKEWRGLASKWLEKRADKFRARKNTLAAFRIMKRSLAWGAFYEVGKWLEVALETEESELLLSLYAGLGADEERKLKDGLALLTNKRSRLKKIRPRIQRTDALASKTKRESREANPRAKSEPAKAARGQPVASKELPVIESSSDPVGESLTRQEILALYEKGLRAYKQSSGQQEQRRIKEAQKHFERAIEAWNVLCESEPAQAEKLEKAMSEMTVLLYDCVKRRKIR
jgi:hypothetical protein